MLSQVTAKKSETTGDFKLKNTTGVNIDIYLVGEDYGYEKVESIKKAQEKLLKLSYPNEYVIT